MLKVGIDPSTGYTLYADSANKIRPMIPRCPCCGAENVLAHANKFKGQHTCVDCGKKLVSYFATKRRLSIRSSIASVERHLLKVDDWITIRNRGLLTPDDLDQERESLCRFIAFEKKAQKLVPCKCVHCGKPTEAPPGAVGPKCPDCSERYKRYRYLQTHLGELDIDQCEEFDSILSHYAYMLHQGHWAPDIPKYRKKIRRRLDELV